LEGESLMFSILSTMQQQKPNNASKAFWLSFAISRYAKSKNLTPDIVFPKLRKFGVMDFLDKHYETEHLENIIYVLEDMDYFVPRLIFPF